MKNVFKFIGYLLVVTIASLLMATMIDPASEQWKAFAYWANILKWILIPTAILFMPKIISRMTKTTHTAESKKLMFQCQVIMGGLFLLIEVSRGLAQ